MYEASDKVPQNPIRYVKLEEAFKSVEPVGVLEKQVLLEIQHIMGDEKGYDEWMRLSAEFTKNENTKYYDVIHFYRARGKYIHHKFNSDMKQWPYH